MAKRPTAAQRDERLKIDLSPNELVEGILEAGPNLDEPEAVKPVAGEGVTQEAVDSANQPDVDGTNEGSSAGS